MRTLVSLALALIGTAVVTSDASAFGKRNRGGGCYGGGYGCNGFSAGGCYGGGYVAPNYGGYRTGCSGGGYVQGGYGCTGFVYREPALPGSPGYMVTSPGYRFPSIPAVGGPAVITSGGKATVIQTTDGRYYTLGADGNYYAAGSMPGVTTTSGWYGNAVIPAGGTLPLTMPGVDPVKPAPAATTNSFRAKQVLGTKIMIQNNTQVGTVADLVFDDAGNMDYLIVSTDNNKLVTVPWDATKFDGEKKTGMVNITQEVWKTVPTYTTTTYPQFYTPTYRTDIYKVYGLTPRELRRIERRIP